LFLNIYLLINNLHYFKIYIKNYKIKYKMTLNVEVCWISNEKERGLKALKDFVPEEEIFIEDPIG